MMETAAPRRLPLAAILAALGGLLAIAGSVLTWATVKADVFGQTSTENVSGTKGGDGTITLVLGILLLICGVVMFMVRAGGGRKAAAVIALLSGLIIAGIGIYDIVDIKQNAINELITEFGGDPEELTDEQRGQFEDAFQISVGIGLYLVVAAGVIGLVGGIMALRGDAGAAVPAAPPAPMAAGAPTDTGFGQTPPAGGTPPPAPPPPPAAPGAP